MHWNPAVLFHCSFWIACLYLFLVFRICRNICCSFYLILTALQNHLNQPTMITKCSKLKNATYSNVGRTVFMCLQNWHNHIVRLPTNQTWPYVFQYINQNIQVLYIYKISLIELQPHVIARIYTPLWDLLSNA